MENIVKVCKLAPIFLAIPTVKMVIFALHENFLIFWELTRVVPHSYFDSIPTRGEQEMLELARVIASLVGALGSITRTCQFGDRDLN